MPKKNKPTVAVEIIPSEKDLLNQLYASLSTEVARVRSKQRSTEESLGLTGAKQINELIKSARGLSEEKRVVSRQDAISQLTDEERLSLLQDLIKRLPVEQKQQLFQNLLEPKKDNE